MNSHNESRAIAFPTRPGKKFEWIVKFRSLLFCGQGRVSVDAE